jgi:hypothetical protein
MERKLTGAALIHLGKPKEGIEVAERAMRVDPQGSDFYLVVLGYGYSAIDRYTDAIAALE